MCSITNMIIAQMSFPFWLAMAKTSPYTGNCKTSRLRTNRPQAGFVQIPALISSSAIQ